METIKNILRSGLATKGNSYKILLSELVNKSKMSNDEVCMALNTITQWNAWNLVIID